MGSIYCMISCGVQARLVLKSKISSADAKKFPLMSQVERKWSTVEDMAEMETVTKRKGRNVFA